MEEIFPFYYVTLPFFHFTVHLVFIEILLWAKCFVFLAITCQGIGKSSDEIYLLSIHLCDFYMGGSFHSEQITAHSKKPKLF